MKLLLRNIQRCSNHVFLLEQLKITEMGKTSRMDDMPENASSDTVNLQTRKWSSSTKFQVLAWMITKSNRKSLNQLENCLKFAHKSSKNACTWHELEDLNIIMWETRHSIVDWVCSKTQTLLEILRTQNQPLEVSCVFLEVEHLFQSVGYARSKLLSRTDPQSLKLFHGWVTCS